MLSILVLILIIIFLAVVSSFIPIGNENSTVRRPPWITFSIMAIKFVIFFVSFPVLRVSRKNSRSSAVRLKCF